jgi:4-amino-4-deoxy-L-arabinose transferase-like glycosyltransferase
MLYDNHSPLYNFLMLLWNHAFGEGELSLRALPFLCGLVAIGVAAAIACKVAGRAEAVIVALIMALSGASVYYSYEARAYSFVTLLALLMVYYLARYVGSGDRRHLRLFIVFSFFCSIGHLYAMMFVVCLSGMLLCRAAGVRSVVPLVRLFLLQIVLAVPFYFFVVLTALFTKEYAYHADFTEPFGVSQIAGFFSFILFGYEGLSRYWPVHVAALAVFAIGLTTLLRRLHDPKHAGNVPAASEATFHLPEMDLVLGGAALSGFVISLGLTCLPFLFRPDWFVSVVPGHDHGELLQQMVGLVGRTARLYLVGYGCTILTWFGLRTRRVQNVLLNAVSLRDSEHLLSRRWREVVVLFPLLGFLPPLIISHLSPYFNTRYLLPLLPFLVLPTAVALCSIRKRWMHAAVITVVAVQVYSLSVQGPNYDLIKPDYRSALLYLYSNARAGYPIADTAEWEADNLNKYYSRRFQRPKLHLVPVSAVPSLPNVSLLVPDRFRLSPKEAADLHLTSADPGVKKIRFNGLTLYELDGMRQVTGAHTE